MTTRRSLAAAAALVVLLALGAGVAQADTLERLEQQQAELQEQRDANALEQERLSSELEGTDASLQQVYLELSRIEGEIPIAEAALAQAQEDLAAAERHQVSINDRLAVAEAEAGQLSTDIETSTAEISATEDGIGELARSTYRGTDGYSALAVLLDASTPEEFATRSTAVGSALRGQGQVLDELETTAANQRNSQARLDAVNVRIGELKVEADAAVIAADEARQSAQDRKNELDQLRADKRDAAAELEAFKDQVETQQAEIAADDAEIASVIQDLANQQAAERQRLAEEAEKARLAAEAAAAAERERQRLAAEEAQRKAEEEAAANNQPPPPQPPAPPQPVTPVIPPPSSASGLIPPVAAPFHVTSPFGMRVYPITGGRYMHNGTDIRSACGNSQVSAAGGTVIGVRPAAGNGTHGNQVLVDHGVINGKSYVTVYNHLSRFAVSSGQWISQGQTIGYTGMTGAVTGCHVHVEVWINGTPTNPENQPGWNRSN